MIQTPDPSAAHLPHVVILNDASVARGGATGLALLSARLLRAAGHRVTYVSGDAGDGGEMAEAGVDLIALGKQPLLKRPRGEALRQGIYDSDVRDRLAQVVARVDTPGTVYHLHGWAQIFSPAVFDALAPVARRCFLHAHDFFLACPNGSYFDFRTEQVCNRVPLSGSCLVTRCDRRSALQKYWRAARQVQVRRGALGRDWAGVLQLHPGMTQRLVRGGVPEQAIHSVRNPAERLVTTRIQAERNTGLVFLGRTESGKGVRLLCEAARRAQLPLRIVGSVEQRPDLPRDYPEVDFVGWVSRDNLGPVLSDCRALVTPSRFAEPFGLVIPEASLSGLPVAVSETAILADDVASSGVGVRVRVSSADELAADLRAFVGKPDAEIRAMSELGYSGAAGLAQTPAAWVDQLSTLYASAVEHV